jgi:alkylhydroperoxidase family enzyme
MARLDYPDLDNAEPAVHDAVEQIRQLRGGRLLNLYRMQLHNPAVTVGWLELGTAVRFNAELDGQTRELAICCVARATGSEYEWRPHRRLAFEQGITESQLDHIERWREADVFDARQRAVLAFTEALTRSVAVDDATFDALREHFPQRQIVELVATIGYYNMVARFLVGLQIDLEPGS